MIENLSKGIVSMDVVGASLGQSSALVLFLVVFAEQVGAPVPSLLVLITAGALVGTGHMNLTVALGVAMSAALAGDLVWYGLGRTRGHRVLGMLCRLALEPDSCVRRTERAFILHGVALLLVAKFIPWLSTVMPVLSGICGMSLTRFLLYDGLGVLIWVGVFEGLGYLSSEQLERLAHASIQAGGAVGVILGGLVVAWVVYKYVLRRRLLERLSVVVRVTPAELEDKLIRGAEVVIIDVRHPLDIAAVPGKVPGALCIPAEEVKLRCAEIPRDQELVVYCACPNEVTSAGVALFLNEKGFAKTYALAGGIEGWREYQCQRTTLSGEEKGLS